MRLLGSPRVDDGRHSLSERLPALLDTGRRSFLNLKSTRCSSCYRSAQRAPQRDMRIALGTTFDLVWNSGGEVGGIRSCREI